MWEVRLRPLHECNGHTIFFRFLGYLAVQRVFRGFTLVARLGLSINEWVLKLGHYSFKAGH